MFVCPQRNARRYHGSAPSALALVETETSFVAPAASAAKSTLAKATVTTADFFRNERRVSRGGVVMWQVYFHSPGSRQNETSSGLRRDASTHRSRRKRRFVRSSTFTRPSVVNVPSRLKAELQTGGGNARVRAMRRSLSG